MSDQMKVNAEERAATIVSRYRLVGILHGWHLDRIAEAVAAAIRDAEREAAERMRERAALAVVDSIPCHFEARIFATEAAAAIRALPPEVTP